MQRDATSRDYKVGEDFEGAGDSELPAFPTSILETVYHGTLG